ncbi:nucleotidyltransferase domain-containing protein [Candidatus Gottesmanbacteria bacterium]|nr:nucleotidyltransferase domain-containing protein [Candidatus Gottesmanbacteria bacterium]
MNGQTLDKIQKIAERIAKISQPEKIILFGSWAWGNPGPDSDVDLCIIKKTDNTRQEAMKIDEQISPRDFPLDIIVYTPEYIAKREALGDFFVRNIVNKGQTLYAHPERT